MLYIYCIRRTADPEPAPSLHGIGGAPVERLAEGPLALWTSAGAAPAPTVERVREHNRVVAAALRSATPLPLRFGTAFPDEAAARAALREHRATWTAGLQRVAERVEMSVLVRWDRGPEEQALGVAPSEAAPPTSGREYLEQRRQRRNSEAALQERARNLLAPVARAFAEMDAEAVHHLLLTPEAAGSVAHLVHRSALSRYRQMFEQARRASAVPLLLSGPWAPYSFV